MQHKVNWIKMPPGNWPNLETVNLANVADEGVYIIWNSNSKAVRVGQGKIADRLSVHRNDNDILSNKGGTLLGGTLFVSWASVSSHAMDGVERYLYDTFNPIVGERAPAVPAIPVNHPE